MRPQGRRFTAALAVFAALGQVPLSPSLPAPAEAGRGRRAPAPGQAGRVFLPAEDRRLCVRCLRRGNPAVVGAGAGRPAPCAHEIPEHPQTCRRKTEATRPGPIYYSRSQATAATSSIRFRLRELRGGNELDAFGQDVEGGNVESALADPEMTKVRAFMPKELRSETRTALSEGDGSFLNLERLKVLFMSKCWFYPLPPWGRKDVFRGESSFLQIWHVVMCLAVFYVGAVEPFRAAGFAVDLKREKPAHDPKQICGKLELWRLDAVVNSIFLVDMCFTAHTAYYKPLGSGRFVLVDDVPNIVMHYIKSTSFLYDVIGILPFRGIFCLMARLLALVREPAAVAAPGAQAEGDSTMGAAASWLSRRATSPVERVLELGRGQGSVRGPRLMSDLFVMLLDATRLFHLMRLHHFRHLWHYLHHKFPRRARMINMAKLLSYLLFASHVMCCAWFWVGVHEVNGWVARQKYTVGSVSSRRE